MNVFNRVIVVLWLLGGILFWILAALFIVFYPFIEKSWLRGLGEGVIGLSERLPLTTLGIAVLAFLAVFMVVIQLIALWLEIIPSRPKTVRLGNVSSGNAVLTVQTIAQRIKFEVEQLDDVAQARPTVHSRRNSVDVQVDVRTPPDVNVAAKSEEVGRVVREALETGLGVKLHRLDINLNLDPSATRSEPRPRPAATTPPNSDTARLDDRMEKLDPFRPVERS